MLKTTSFTYVVHIAMCTMVHGIICRVLSMRYYYYILDLKGPKDSSVFNFKHHMLVYLAVTITPQLYHRLVFLILEL